MRSKSKSMEELKNPKVMEVEMEEFTEEDDFLLPDELEEDVDLDLDEDEFEDDDDLDTDEDEFEDDDDLDTDEDEFEDDDDLDTDEDELEDDDDLDTDEDELEDDDDFDTDEDEFEDDDDFDTDKDELEDDDDFDTDEDELEDDGDLDTDEDELEDEDDIFSDTVELENDPFAFIIETRKAALPANKKMIMIVTDVTYKDVPAHESAHGNAYKSFTIVGEVTHPTTKKVISIKEIGTTKNYRFIQNVITINGGKKPSTLKELIGKKVIVTIKHEKDNNGNVWDNIDTVQSYKPASKKKTK